MGILVGQWDKIVECWVKQWNIGQDGRALGRMVKRWLEGQNIQKNSKALGRVT